MNLNEYQAHARSTALAFTPDHMVAGLVEEAGECAGVMKRFYRGDKDYMTLHTSTEGRVILLSDFAVGRLMAEAGDVLWYVAMLADVLGVSLEDIATLNLEKLQRRKAKDTIQGSGDDR